MKYVIAVITLRMKNSINNVSMVSFYDTNIWRDIPVPKGRNRTRDGSLLRAVPGKAAPSQRPTKHCPAVPPFIVLLQKPGQ